ncbi:hypothetical protein [Streptomyces hydrogenans]|uniref:hypothetical protein n=1 Tax=Streptomyces hydrogenans TaxID=1873719 RepID=UPI0033FE6194
MVLIEHAYGDVECSLAQWISTGPGARCARPAAGRVSLPRAHPEGDVSAVFLDQPMEDPDVRVPLHARRVQVRPQDLVDHRLVAIHSGRPRRQHLARPRPGRIRSLPRRPPRHAVLALKLRIDMPPQ